MLEMTVEAGIGSSPSESFLTSEPTESILAVVEVHVDDRFVERDVGNRVSPDSVIL